MKIKHSKNLYLLFAFAGILLFSCTDLKENILNEQDGDRIVLNPENAEMIVASSYAVLRDFLGAGGQVWGMNEISTDEVAYPARGTDGYVPDRQAIFAHRFAANNTRIRDGWNLLLSNFAITNVSLYYLHQLPETEEVRHFIAEVTFIRALLMFHVNDLWGVVPFREYDETDYQTYPMLLSRQEALDRIIRDLEESIPVLKQKSSLPYGRISKATAQMLLAKVYLNYEVYTGTSKWKEAEELCDQIIQSGEYKLADDYFAMFEPDNAGYAHETEAILSIVHDALLGIGGFTWPQQVLHYNQLFGTFTSLWNIGCTTGSFVDTWDESDPRFRDDRTVATCGFNLGFMIGQQYSVSGEPLTTRLGEPLVFTKEFSIYNSKEEQGVRVLKYAPDPTSINPESSSNDFLWYRYADVILMAAEAKYRSGNTSGALEMINRLRAARKVELLDTVDPDKIYHERGYELYWEGHRRTDMIRFNKFREPRQEKEYETPEHMLLFPIPVSALEANSELKQNPGY